jgi:pimeloyl-ACP methyl ester carboxylesterase
MANRNESAPRKRFHIVLVPGFGGFDALGKIEYYAGVTRIFQQWNTGKPAVLHYFDNLPTAAVVTRAARLQSYLAKRMARGEILEGDEIILVGHSTGGLDIRQLVSDLHDKQNPEIHVDGGIPVYSADLRRRVCRVVFLSVPHWGTNIADWVVSHACLRKTVVTELRAAVAGSQVYLLDRLENRIAGAAAFLTGADLLRASQDTLREANGRYGEPGPQRTAEAHEAAAELALYFRDMASDFHVIEDLTSQPPESEPKSPAHFNREQRKKEFQRWNDPPIETLSYATVARSPFRFVSGSPAPVWDLANPCTYPEISKDARLSVDTDISYRLCYRACAGGPFQRPAEGGRVTRYLNGAPQGRLEIWDNDGIVNTLSMLWPKSPNVLVAADHLDIVGHYKPVKVERKRVGSGGRPAREYRSYDLLKSVPKFNNQTFEQVWTEIFNFSIGRKGPNSPGEYQNSRASRQAGEHRVPVEQA